MPSLAFYAVLSSSTCIIVQGSAINGVVALDRTVRQLSINIVSTVLRLIITIDVTWSTLDLFNTYVRYSPATHIHGALLRNASKQVANIPGVHVPESLHVSLCAMGSAAIFGTV